jgi:hypothetical protein
MTTTSDYSRGPGFFTAVYKVPAGWKPGDEIMANPLMTAVSWSHAIHDRDVALEAARKAGEVPVHAGHFLEDLHRWLKRAHFPKPNEQQDAGRFAEQIRLALDNPSAAHNLEDARAKFEAWAASRAHGGDLSRLESGEYADYATQCAWSGVQFALSQKDSSSNRTFTQEEMERFGLHVRDAGLERVGKSTDDLQHLARMLAKMYVEFDRARYEAAALPEGEISDFLITKIPVLQGTGNQVDLLRISEQPYDSVAAGRAIRALRSAEKESRSDSQWDRIEKLLPPTQSPASEALPTLIGIPSIVRQALDIAHDLAVAQADHVHEAYKGYKQHKHDAADRDVAVIKKAIDVIKDAPDVELASEFYTREELAIAYSSCAIPDSHFKSIESVLKTQRGVVDEHEPPRLRVMALCESVRLGLRPDQPYIFRVHEKCDQCAQLAAPYANGN